jgi:hypothetical protein
MDRVIIGEVQEKEQARATFQKAVDRGEVAGLLEQLPDASDVFTTTIGNVPPNSTVYVKITYLGELKHDAEVDGLRFTIPTMISPRYGSYPGEMSNTDSFGTIDGKFEVTVDTLLDEGNVIREIRSPSHPIAVSMGILSTAPDGTPALNQSSATLSLGSAELDRDFVLQVVSKELGTPKALLEDHPNIPGQRALMATLVPKFQLPTQRPEIVFVCDRSGSMSWPKMEALKSALKVFLKSLPIGVVFNICSFGSRHDYLWTTSKSYSQENMDKALKHIQSFSANYGGTEMLQPIKNTIQRRHKDRPLEVFLVTDGEIWDQQSLFDHLNLCIKEKKEPVRVFTLGIGDGVSHSLIEGVARCGNGFSQSVGENEKMDSKVVRMLKGALFPHITDYTLEVKYGNGTSENDDFEMVEDVSDSLKIDMDVDILESKVVRSFNPNHCHSFLTTKQSPVRKAISLFDPNVNLHSHPEDGEDPFKHLPKVTVPKLLQAPNEIPPLYPFNRTTVYLLLAPGTQGTPESVMLKGTSSQGPVELEIPIQHLAHPGESIHQLAAKKAIQELEEGHGWLHAAKTNGKLLKDELPSYMDEIVRREAVRLGVQFQVGGKFCSFVAAEKNVESQERTPEDFEFLDDEVDKLTLVEGQVDLFNDSSSLVSESGNIVLTKGVTSAKRSKRAFNPIAKGLGAVSYAYSAMSSRSRSGNRTSPTSDFSVATDMSVPSDRSARPNLLHGVTPGTARYSSGGYGQHTLSTSAKLNNGFVASSAAFDSEDCDDGSVTRDEDMSLRKSQNSYRHEAASPKPMAQYMQSISISKKQKTYQPGAEGSYGEYKKSEEAASGGSSDILHALISLQKFEGCWEWEKALWTLLKVDPKKADQMAPKTDKQNLATVLAITFFETKLVSEKDTWELVVEKAYDWLNSKPRLEKEFILKVAIDLLA